MTLPLRRMPAVWLWLPLSEAKPAMTSLKWLSIPFVTSSTGELLGLMREPVMGLESSLKYQIASSGR
jgi:hypothetical protein